MNHKKCDTRLKAVYTTAKAGKWVPIKNYQWCSKCETFVMIFQEDFKIESDH